MNKVSKGKFVASMLLSLTLIGVLIIAVSISYSNKTTPRISNNKLTVVTSFYPMYIAACNVTKGADINLYNLSEPQTGCLHDYQLTTQDMKLLSQADVFIINGGGMEEFLGDALNLYPNLTVIDASNDIEMIDDNAHMWMSITSYKQQVSNIASGLCECDPDNISLYEANAAAYIDKLDKLLDMSLDDLSGDKVILFSEAYEYLARDCGLEVAAILDLDEEKEVSAVEVAEIIDVIRREDIPLIIAEKQYGEKMAQIVTKETGAQVVYLDTIIRGDYDEDSYINAMRSNLKLLREAASWTE